jgi:hypothetical protein
MPKADITLRVNLFLTGKVRSKVIINPADQCKVLQTLFQNEKMILVYKGMKSDEDRSFEFYGIETSETVVALLETNDPVRQVGRWLQTSRDSEAFD